MHFTLYAIFILEIILVVILTAIYFFRKNNIEEIKELQISRIVRSGRIGEMDYRIVQIDKKYHIQERMPGFFSSFHTYEYAYEGNLDTIHVQCIYDTLEEAEENYKGMIANVEKYGDVKRPYFDLLAPGFGKAPNPFK